MQASPRAPWVRYNNIIGEMPPSLVAEHTLGDQTDGVVSVASARTPDAEPAVVGAARFT